MSSFWAEHAWLGGGAVVAGVTIDVDAGVITAVQSGTRPAPDAMVLPGVLLPGLANVHSHAFHRALRGRTQRGGGTFWTWREQMYAVADRLTPDSYYTLARATFAEMVLSGITCVGEFHYVHHDKSGVSYDDPNAMGAALIRAAGDAGIRLTLLDTCYLTGGIGLDLDGPQVRFGDADADAWASRAEALATTTAAHGFVPMVRLGAAIHSVRAVPADQLGTVAAWAARHDTPLHVHLSEQRAENEQCLAIYGRTPTQLLAEGGVLGPGATAIHATHLTDADTTLLGASGTGVCMCPTTERDLADGLGAAGALEAAGSPLTLGSDSNAVIDLWAEARGLEFGERLRSERRGHWTASQLLRAATAHGHDALGWAGGGRLVLGAPADFVTVRVDGVRLAGAGPLLEAIVFAAEASDVSEVVVAGRRVVAAGVHQLVEDVPGELASSISAVTS